MSIRDRGARERNTSLEVLKDQYNAPQRLRKTHKLLAKAIKSIEQGHDGKVGICYFCKRLFPIELLQLHHKDYVESHNTLDNLELADQHCNNVDHGLRQAAMATAPLAASLRERERANTGHPYADAGTDWHAREGEKGEEMRFRYNRWRDDLLSGPFRSIGGSARLSKIAEKAVYGCSPDPTEPFGSSKTYTVYIKEDIAAGIYDAWKEGAIWLIRYLGPRKVKELPK